MKIFKKALVVFIIISSLLVIFLCGNKNDSELGYESENNNITETKKYYDKSSIVKYSGFDDSAKLTFEELRELAGQAKELKNIKRKEKNIPPDNFSFDLDRYYTGIVKDRKDRISYYEYGELQTSGIYQVKGYGGLEDLKCILIDNSGYLKKNFFLQDYITRSGAGVKRSYYVGEDYNVVKDADIKFNSDTLSNKRILYMEDTHHFGKDMHLTKRVQVGEDGKEKSIKGKWQKDENGELQYMNPNGYIAKESMISYTVNKKNYKCYVDEKGKMVKNYYLQDFDIGNGRFDYYFDNDGLMGRYDMRTFVIVDKNTSSNKPIDGKYKLELSYFYGKVMSITKLE